MVTCYQWLEMTWYSCIQSDAEKSREHHQYDFEKFSATFEGKGEFTVLLKVVKSSSKSPQLAGIFLLHY